MKKLKVKKPTIPSKYKEYFKATNTKVATLQILNDLLKNHGMKVSTYKDIGEALKVYFDDGTDPGAFRSFNAPEYAIFVAPTPTARALLNKLDTQ